MTEEHKRRTADMIAVMQAYVDGKPIKVKHGTYWLSIEEPGWTWDVCQYRIATIPDSINWEHVSPEWKYMARDEDGKAYIYSAEPWVDDGRWVKNVRDDLTCADGFASYVRGTVDWKDSLVRRPS